jgi:hypothetical protein
VLVSGDEDCPLVLGDQSVRVEQRSRTEPRTLSPRSHADVIRAGLAEQHDEWAVARRYMSVESVAKALPPPAGEPEEAAAIGQAA